MRIRPVILIAVPLALLVFSPGCADMGPTDDQILRDIQLHRGIWEGKRPSAYVFQLARGCNCGDEGRGPVWIRVRGTQVVSRVYSASGEPVASNLEGAFPSVEGLFDLLEQAAKSDPWSINISWDPELGYPVSIWVDYDGSTINDEVGYSVVTPPRADTGS